MPQSISALYELSRLAPEQIDQAINNGDINPDMTIRDAKTLTDPPKPPPQPDTGQCIHCRATLPLTQLYEGGQGYECDPCVQPDLGVPEQELPPLPEPSSDAPPAAPRK